MCEEGSHTDDGLMDAPLSSSSGGVDGGNSASGGGTYTSESDSEPAPRKKPRYSCSFHPELNMFAWARVSRKGPLYAFCTLCKRDISIAYGGQKDLRKHEGTNLHLSATRAVCTSGSLRNYVSSSGPRRDQSVVKAEVKFSYFIGEHHLALAVADHCSKLFTSMFPDSNIARAFKCGRTKATATVKVIAQDIMKNIVARIGDANFFSIQIDETTDITVYEQMGIMLRYFDNTDGKVCCMFYKLEPIISADAEGIFSAIDQNFNDSDPICYSKLVGVGSDGCNVMLGSRNSVLTRLRTKQPSLISFHCNCHVAALIANHACGKFPGYLDDITIQIWYFFHKSPKRQRSFEHYQVFTECKAHKLLKASQTRWLSLEACVNRLLEQYEALLSYFRSTDEKSATVTRITEGLEKHITKAYLMFLSDSLPIINIFDKMMQQQSPTIHFLGQEINAFVKKLLLRFMEPQAIQDRNVNISKINVNDSSKHKVLSEVFIGDKAKNYIDECDDLSTSDIKRFQENCKNFWIAAAEYAIKKLPLNNKLLGSVSWIFPSTQNLELENQVLGAAAELPQVISVEKKSSLREEFIDYCTYQLPSHITSITDIVSYWHQVGKITDHVSGNIRFPLLSQLAKAILVIPHGNADIERMFSQLGLNKTKLRSSLGTETLTALLRLQMNINEPCYNFSPGNELVEKCKNAMASLKD